MLGLYYLSHHILTSLGAIFFSINVTVSYKNYHSPPLKDPSPIIAITLSFSSFMSLVLARQQARLIEVEVCPILKKSCLLSSGLE